MITRMLKTVCALALLAACAVETSDEKGTAVSLAMKDEGVQVATVQAADGDLYRQLLHHAPAVENKWAAYRIYFNQHLSVDILSKFQPRLELAEGQWYGGGRDPDDRVAGIRRRTCDQDRPDGHA